MMIDWNIKGVPLPDLPESYPHTVYDDSRSWYQYLKRVAMYLNDIGKLTDDMRKYLEEFLETFDENLYSTLEKILVKWLKDGVFEEIMLDIILLIGDLDNFRPEDKTLIEKIKNELGERGINIKWFGVKSGDFIDVIVNNIIETFWTEELGVHIYFPSGHYFSENSININRSYIKLEGSGKTLIEFRQTDNTIKAETTNMLSIGNTDSELTRIIIDGIHFTKGIQSCEIKVTWLYLNISRQQENAITDCSFKNSRVYNMDVGIQSQYIWGMLFENIRIQNATRPMALDSQSNNLLFNRVSFVSFTQPITFINNEGIEFNSCEIANFDGVHAIWLYHSSLSLINPYIENISNNGNKIFANIGSYNDGNSSNIEIIGGKITGDKIIIRHSSQYPLNITLTNTQYGKIEIQPVKVTEGEKTVITDFVLNKTMQTNLTKNNLAYFDGSKDVVFKKAWPGNSGVFTQDYNEASGQKTLVYDDEEDSSQGILVEGLIKDEFYTVIYNLEEDGVVFFRNGTKPTVLLKKYGEKDVYLLITADSTTCRFEISGGKSATINKLVVTKGIKFPTI